MSPYEQAALICDELAEMRESGAGDSPRGHRLRQAARMIRALDKPLETGLDEREYSLVSNTQVAYMMADGVHRETLKRGTRVWLARWTEDELEAARRNAEELHRKLHSKPESDQ